MTNPYAKIPLTYDGEDLQLSDFGIFLQIVQGLNEKASVRGKDVIVPARDGRLVRPRRPDLLPIVLSGCVLGSGDDDVEVMESYRQRSRFVRDLFDPARDPADLVATLEDSTTGTISCRPIGSPVWNETRVSIYADIVIALESLDPEWVFT